MVMSRKRFLFINVKNLKALEIAVKSREENVQIEMEFIIPTYRQIEKDCKKVVLRKKCLYSSHSSHL